VKKINQGQSDSQIARLKWGSSSQAQRAIKSRKKKVIMGQSDYLGQKFGQRGLALKKN